MNGLAVVVPCYNEEGRVSATYESILCQTVKPEYVIMVDDCSKDGTFAELSTLKPKEGVELIVLRTPQNSLRCGAMNYGLSRLRPTTKYVVLMDAGTGLDVDAFENAVRELESDESIGIVCSTAGVKQGRGLLHRLQKLEYGGFDATRLSTKDNVLICHGLFSVARADVLRSVGFYSSNVFLEDYDLTVKIKLKGYKAVFRPSIKAYTDTHSSLRKLARQRYRWYLGGLDILSKHGFNKATRSDIFDHCLFFMLLGTIVSSIILGGRGGLQFTWWSLIPIGFAVFGWVRNMYFLKLVQDRDWRDILLRAILLPELAYSMFLSGIQIAAYMSKVYTRGRRW